MKNNINYILLTLSIFLLPFLFSEVLEKLEKLLGLPLVAYPYLFLFFDIGHRLMGFEIAPYLFTIILPLWALISYYLPIQISNLFCLKDEREKKTLKRRLVWIVCYISCSSVLQVGFIYMGFKVALYLFIIVLFLWILIPYYLLIQISNLFCFKDEREKKTLKRKLAWIVCYILCFSVLQIGFLYFSYCTFKIGPSNFLGYKVNCDFFLIRFTIAVFIIWALYRNRYNLKKVCTHEFWNFKVIKKTIKNFLFISLLAAIFTALFIYAVVTIKAVLDN